MIKLCTKLLFVLINVFLLSACGYQPINLKYSDIAQKRKIDMYIDSIIVQPTTKETGGLIKSINDSDYKDDDNRIHHVKKGNAYINWNATLDQAISESGIFNPKSKNILALRVTALDIRYPGWGGDFPTDITAKYELINTSNSKKVFTTEIKSHAQSAPFAYINGHMRWKEAINRTINQNVRLFIEALIKSNQF